MIELRREAGLLPCRRAVTGFATLLKFPMVRVGMAVRAVCELYPCIAWLAVGSRRMATFTGRSAMRPSQRKARLRVIECLLLYTGALPVLSRMALRACCPESSLMFVFVAANAACGESEPRVIQILACQVHARLRGDMLHAVA